MNHFFLFLCALCGPPWVVTESLPPVVSPFDERTAEIVTIDEQALASASQAMPRRRVVVFVPSFRCEPCERLKRDCGAGDAQVEIEYQPASQAPFAVPGFPYIWLPDVNRQHVGAVSMPQLKEMLAKNRPANQPSTVGAVTIGTIRAKEALAAVFAGIKNTGSESVVTLGQASIVVPAEMPSTWVVEAESMQLRFTGRKPRLRLGTSFFSVGREVAGIKITPNVVMVSIDGFPDLAFAVE